MKDSTFQMTANKLEWLHQQVSKTKIDFCEISYRNQVVFTHARNANSANKLHKINSITKSVLSLLVGIALDQKLIERLETPISNYFPQLKDTEAADLTLVNLLTMTTGWDWPEWGAWEGLPKPMISSPDWVHFILSRPMKDQSGTRMIYNSGSSHLLSAILQKISGMTTAQYAEKHLFRPLGINEYRWYSDAKGIVIGGFGLELKAPDLHKLGQLMLGKGVFEGRTIVSDTWVHQIVEPRFHTYDHVGSYGYHWWIMNDEQQRPAVPLTYFAMGYGGQYVFVTPELELVVTFASTLYKQTFLPYRLYKDLFLQ
jgi:CubicO group peptidase (beta-lactamase class C family)